MLLILEKHSYRLQTSCRITVKIKPLHVVASFNLKLGDHMLSRRNLNIGLGACLLHTLTGCDNSSHSSTNNSPVIAKAVIDVAALFWGHPVIKFLSFLKIISSSLDTIQHNENSTIVKFDTTNPNVRGVFDLSSNNENDQCNFSTPKGDVYLSPAHFMRVNDISFGDNNRLNYIDGIIQTYYDQCTDETLDSGEGEQGQMLELRAQCIENKNTSEVNSNYSKVKHAKYEI